MSWAMTSNSLFDESMSASGHVDHVEVEKTFLSLTPRAHILESLIWLEYHDMLGLKVAVGYGGLS